MEHMFTRSIKTLLSAAVFATLLCDLPHCKGLQNTPFWFFSDFRAMNVQKRGWSCWSACTPPPLQSPGVARDGLPGGGGRRSPSDGVPGGGGRLQGYLKANSGTLH